MHFFTPMFAEIVDKMPSLETVWTTWLVIGLVVAVVTVALSLARLWIGGIAVAISLALGLFATWPESMNDQIIRELGSGYLWQQRISGFVPFILAVAIWILVWISRRPNQSPEPTGVIAGWFATSRRFAEVAVRRWLSFHR